MCGLGGEVGDDALLIYIRCGAQFDTACDAIPVALRLVGNAVGVLSDADVLDAVIDADGNLVVTTEAQVGGDVVLMRNGEAHLVAYFVAVDDDGGLDVRAFEEEGDALSFPCPGDGDGAAVGGFANEMLCRGEEEGKLHLAGTAVGLHEGVEVVAGVVERACPAGVDREVVAEAVGEEGAR